MDYEHAILLNLSRPDFHLPRRVVHEPGDPEPELIRDTEKYDWKAALKGNRPKQTGL